MIKSDFKLEFIKENQALKRLAGNLQTKSVFALDIETTDWWNRSRERIALIQFAFREGQSSKVSVIDALADLHLDILRSPLEDSSITKVIHNANFDASRIAVHYNIRVKTVHDTMAAARSNGERKYSLKAQAETHLKLYLDKSTQRSDWSKRPLDTRQLYYAAADAHATLLLYENQLGRNLNNDFRLKSKDPTKQVMLPLGELPETLPVRADLQSESTSTSDLTNLAISLLGIIAELPTRYGPDSLAVSVGQERVGLAGWIIDRRLGKDADPDEETIKMTIADLCERGLLQITGTRRLEATEKGSGIWQKLKNI